MQADVVQQTSGGAVQLSASLPDLILLKGAPGVGKSTTAKLLAQHLPSGVRVEVDTLRQMVVSVDWTNQAEHRSLLALSAQLAAGFLRTGFAPVILVDTFSGDKIDGFLDAFRSESPLSRVLVAVLHASEGVLRGRVRNRDADGFSNIDIALRINQEVVRDVRPFEMLLDSSDLAPADVAATILTLARALPVETSRP
ncbi:MAG: AAA family ATPase [Phycisphaerales bacterium]|nr:AAA family ATPase [Phycisphaerales bacterium]